MDRMIVVRLVGRTIGKLHHPAKLVPLRARRDVGADKSLIEAGDLSLKALNLLNGALFLGFIDFRLPAKEKGMHDHEV
jgi:hypothetical protein